MPAKDQAVKHAIESVMGSTRKGRNKIIRLVQKQHPYLSASKIRRVYVKEGFSLMKKPRRRLKNNPANPIIIKGVASSTIQSLASRCMVVSMEKSSGSWSRFIEDCPKTFSEELSIKVTCILFDRKSLFRMPIVFQQRGIDRSLIEFGEISQKKVRYLSASVYSRQRPWNSVDWNLSMVRFCPFNLELLRGITDY